MQGNALLVAAAAAAALLSRIDSRVMRRRPVIVFFSLFLSPSFSFPNKSPPSFYQASKCFKIVGTTLLDYTKILRTVAKSFAKVG